MHGDFFSHVYHTFTRWTTDFFQMWLTADMKLLFLLIMLQFVWTFILKSFIKSRTPWRCKTSLFSNEDLISFISQQIDFCISVNKTPHVSAAVLWEVLKPILGGKSVHVWAQTEDWNFIYMIIYMPHPCPQIYKERLSLQSEFDILFFVLCVFVCLKALNKP